MLQLELIPTKPADKCALGSTAPRAPVPGHRAICRASWLIPGSQSGFRQGPPGQWTLVGYFQKPSGCGQVPVPVPRRPPGTLVGTGPSPRPRRPLSLFLGAPQPSLPRSLVPDLSWAPDTRRVRIQEAGTGSWPRRGGVVPGLGDLPPGRSPPHLDAVLALGSDACALPPESPAGLGVGGCGRALDPGPEALGHPTASPEGSQPQRFSQDLGPCAPRSLLSSSVVAPRPQAEPRANARQVLQRSRADAAHSASGSPAAGARRQTDSLGHFTAPGQSKVTSVGSDII